MLLSLLLESFLRLLNLTAGVADVAERPDG